MIAKAKEFLDTGYDHVYVHQIGPDQDALFRFWEQSLRDELASLRGSRTRLD